MKALPEKEVAHVPASRDISVGGPPHLAPRLVLSFKRDNKLLMKAKHGSELKGSKFDRQKAAIELRRWKGSYRLPLSQGLTPPAQRQ